MNVLMVLMKSLGAVGLPVLMVLVSMELIRFCVG